MSKRVHELLFGPGALCHSKNLKSESDFRQTPSRIQVDSGPPVRLWQWSGRRSRHGPSAPGPLPSAGAGRGTGTWPAVAAPAAPAGQGAGL